MRTECRCCCCCYSLCAPVLVPQMLGTGEPPDTMNRSSLHLLSVASGCASTKLLKSSLKESFWNSVSLQN